MNTELEIMRGILDSYPYPIVFVDGDFIIRFMNKRARYHYYEERGYGPLLGKCLFDCHTAPGSEAMIRKAWASICQNGKEIFLKVNARNERIFIQGVRGEDGRWIGFFERFEQNYTHPNFL